MDRLWSLCSFRCVLSTSVFLILNLNDRYHFLILGLSIFSYWQITLSLKSWKKKKWEIATAAYKSVLSSHSVEITEFLSRSDFTWNQNWLIYLCRSAKSAISIHLEILNFAFYEPWRLNSTKWTKFRAPKMVKNGSFRTYRFSKIDFT